MLELNFRETSTCHAQGYENVILTMILWCSYRYKLFGNGDIQRLHEDAGLAIKRWPLTAGYILRPDGIPISESASEQAYEIFNGIAEEAENLARLRLQHHEADRHSRQVKKLLKNQGTSFNILCIGQSPLDLL